MSYWEFCVSDISSHSFILGQAFYCPCKTPFSWFVWVIAWVQAIACTLCQGLGKMKDESERKIIGEFVGLKSKIYSIKNTDGKESDTEKVVNIATEFNEFKDTLFNKKIIRHKMRRTQGKKQKMGTQKISKISLSVFWWQKICFKQWYSYACLFS